MKIQFIYAFNVTYARSKNVNAAEKNWGAQKCMKDKQHVPRKCRPRNKVRKNSQRCGITKRNVRCLENHGRKIPEIFKKKFNKTRGTLTADQPEKAECRPKTSVKDVIMKTHPGTQEEKISRKLWNLCKYETSIFLSIKVAQIQRR